MLILSCSNFIDDFVDEKITTCNRRSESAGNFNSTKAIKSLFHNKSFFVLSS